MTLWAPGFTRPRAVPPLRARTAVSAPLCTPAQRRSGAQLTQQIPRYESAEQQQRVQPPKPRTGPGRASPRPPAAPQCETKPRRVSLLCSRRPPQGRGEEMSTPAPPSPPWPQGCAGPAGRRGTARLTASSHRPQGWGDQRGNAPRLTALGRVLLCPVPRRGAAPRRALTLPVQFLLQQGQGRVLLGQGQRSPGQGQDGQRHPQPPHGPGAAGRCHLPRAHAHRFRLGRGQRAPPPPLPRDRQGGGRGRAAPWDTEFRPGAAWPTAATENHDSRNAPRHAAARLRPQTRKRGGLKR